MYAAPAYWSIGMKARTPIATQQPIGVSRRGWTQRSAGDPGSWSSRDMPNMSRIVDAWIERQQTKIATDTTSR